MSTYGFKDGILNVNAVKLGQKRYVEDIYTHVLSSATHIKPSVSISATTSIYLATTIDHPRNIMVKNVMLGAAERKMKLVVKGYTGQGAYNEEVLTLSSAATGVTRGNVAFAHITEIVPAVATKGYGTYSTVSIYPGLKVGLSEYVDDEDDILSVQLYNRSASRTAVGTTLISTTNFNKTYQTLNILSLNPIGSTVNIKYRSKFQNKETY